MDPERLGRIERDLSELRAVRAVRLMADGEQIQEVHIIALPGRDVKGIVRDVVTTLFAWHGIRLNHRKISVAVMGQHDMKKVKESDAVEVSTDQRLEYVSVNSLLQGSRVEAQVELSWGGGSLFGSQTGANTPESRLRLVGEAALDAVQQATREGHQWSLGDALKFRLGEGEAIAVKVLLLSGRRRSEMAGCALIGSYPDEAVVFAVLQATNRAGSQLLRPVWTEYDITATSEIDNGVAAGRESVGGP
ncbi:MAG: hypothetical protein KJ970_09945 [Candidatus Eisenbacteria bacterium]|uniref:Uncharacterized protein n=1 Tax=Eiseniibacteriota bacterium TaxID=2212470 RepID=A0A948W6K8_UNCEI|nr:hypothetical protein [Candidatus Eisenbacteria bacterium]MBU1949626.1 hypothetical protein [Candidatus Eisenbacteria bacterium]MBU2691240.1 hypothetical protein [Candidatus Eisenbacteria bacterium]